MKVQMVSLSKWYSCTLILRYSRPHCQTDVFDFSLFSLQSRSISRSFIILAFHILHFFPPLNTALRMYTVVIVELKCSTSLLALLAAVCLFVFSSLTVAFGLLHRQYI